MRIPIDFEFCLYGLISTYILYTYFTYVSLGQPAHMYLLPISRYTIKNKHFKRKISRGQNRFLILTLFALHKRWYTALKMQYSRSKNRLNTQPITLCHQNVRECVMREKGAGCVFV